MEPDQLIEYNTRNTLEKSFTKCGGDQTQTSGLIV